MDIALRSAGLYFFVFTVMRILGVFHPSGDPASRSYDEAKSS